jgi:chorismate mutase/prephenate dehydratase
MSENEPKRGLSELRQEIDAMDAEIVKLINQRARIAMEIGAVKHASGAPIYSPAREKQVARRVREANKGPLPDECIEAVYREIISGCLALEKPVTVCYLGPKGTFSELAALKRFGHSAEYVMAGTLGEIFENVERGRSEYGVVPVENSTEGGIHETLGCFLTSRLKVCAEITLAVRLCLLGRCAVKDVKRVYSKGAALGQCREWLATNLAEAELREASSTAKAAEHAQVEEGSAAVGRSELAGEYGLQVLAESIEDYPHNYTRFFVISTHTSRPSGEDKTSILCSVKDKVGALHDLLRPFKEAGINITRIESFPSPTTAFQYYFFIDFEGHLEDAKVAALLEEVRAECATLRILGAFPKG